MKKKRYTQEKWHEKNRKEGKSRKKKEKVGKRRK